MMESVVKDNYPLHYACWHNNINDVRQLLDDGFYTKEIWVGGLTPLITACRRNHYDIAKLLLDHPSLDPNVQNEDGYTVFHIACSNNNLPIVKLLLDHPSCDPNKEALGELHFLQLAYWGMLK